MKASRSGLRPPDLATVSRPVLSRKKRRQPIGPLAAQFALNESDAMLGAPMGDVAEQQTDSLPSHDHTSEPLTHDGEPITLPSLSRLASSNLLSAPISQPRVELTPQPTHEQRTGEQPKQAPPSLVTQPVLTTSSNESAAKLPLTKQLKLDEKPNVESKQLSKPSEDNRATNNVVSTEGTSSSEPVDTRESSTQEVVQASSPEETAAKSSTASPASSSQGSEASTAVAAPTTEASSEATLAKPAADSQSAPSSAESVADPETQEAPPAAEPARDAGLQAVVGQVKEAAIAQRSHAPAAAKASEASAAAHGPSNEVAALAGAQQVGVMDQQEPQKFNREEFVATLMSRIESVTPTTLDQADQFKKENRAAGLKGELTGQVSKSKDAAQGNVAAATTATPSAAGIEATSGAELPAAPKPPIPQVASDAAVPPPASEQRVSLAAESQSLDNQMTGGGVTREQLEKSNEPEFQSALASKDAAQQNAIEAPVAYRSKEQQSIAEAKSTNQAAVGQDLTAMAGARGSALGAVFGKQSGAKENDEAKRAQVTSALQGIYDKTKSDVEGRLSKLDSDVDARFESAATSAQTEFQNFVNAKMEAYKDERYSGIEGKLLWVKDRFTGLPDEVNAFYVQGKTRYIDSMKSAMNDIAGLVDIGLTEAKALIVNGKKQVDTYVKSQPQELQKFAKEAAGKIGAQFDQLEQSVNDKQNQIIDGLVNRFQEKLTALDAEIDKMKAENRGLVDAAKDAMTGVINTVLELKNMLLGVLAKAGDVVTAIISDPIGFLGNLVAGVGAGLQSFVGNIATHLKEGFFAWLFGAMAAAGIQVPKQWDLKGIFGLVLQVLGATYQYFRSRAVKMVGEKVVSTVESTAEIFTKFVTEGPMALWEYVKEQAGGLVQELIDGIKSFLAESVIKAGIMWIISLLNPASAFVKACKMIFDIVQFFLTRGQQVLALVNAILDSVSAIAKGSLGQAAKFIESSLIKALPVAIGFLASLVGLGGLSDRIAKMIQRIQAPVNKAIDWVITKIVGLAKKAKSALGFKDKSEKPDPDHDLKLAKGIAYLTEKSEAAKKNGKISKLRAKTIAIQARVEHRVFKSVDVIVAHGDLYYDYTASPRSNVGPIPTANDQAEGDLADNRSRELPPGQRRTPAENKQARNYFKNNKQKARDAYTHRTGKEWPVDGAGNPWPAEHVRPLKEGGDPMVVEPRNPATDPHSIPGADGLTDYQRWGSEGTPARKARKKGLL